MRKLFLLLALLAVIPLIKAQEPIVGYHYPAMNTALGKKLQMGNFIFIETPKRIIQITQDFTASATPASIIVSGKYREYNTILSGTATAILLADTIHVANAEIKSTSIAVCSYAVTVAAGDSTCLVKTIANGYITFQAKHNKAFYYIIHIK